MVVDENGRDIMSITISFNRNTCIKNEPIIIYGASVYGELAFVALKKSAIFQIIIAISQKVEKNILEWK